MPRMDNLLMVGDDKLTFDAPDHCIYGLDFDVAFVQNLEVAGSVGDTATANKTSQDCVKRQACEVAWTTTTK